MIKFLAIDSSLVNTGAAVGVIKDGLWVQEIHLHTKNS